MNTDRKTDPEDELVSMLPKILQWFSGNIGFHHLHHLSPRIPNYLLERCYRENLAFQRVQALTLRSSLKSLRLRLYDEDSQKLVGYRELKGRLQPQQVGNRV